jgi:hypothetical protein
MKLAIDRSFVKTQAVRGFPPKKDRLDGATSRRSEKREKELKSQEGRASTIILTLPFLLTFSTLANFLPLHFVECIFISS